MWMRQMCRSFAFDLIFISVHCLHREFLISEEKAGESHLFDKLKLFIKIIFRFCQWKKITNKITSSVNVYEYRRLNLHKCNALCRGIKRARANRNFGNPMPVLTDSLGQISWKQLGETKLPLFPPSGRNLNIW